MGEFDLIARIHARAASRHDVILGIGDDAALLQVPAGKQLVVTMDTLNGGVHFPAGTAPADIGWKALAVNLSDLAAMGARPVWCTLSLSLPEPDTAWLDAFLDGFLALAGPHGIALVGGDTTHGPLSVCVAAHGLVEAGSALRRDGARAGDDVWVTGTLGDAAAALAQWRASLEKPGAGCGSDPEITVLSPALRERLERPTPRIAAGLRLAGLAHSCIDVSDGLLADLGHICARSGVGAEIELVSLPASAALQEAFDIPARWQLQTCVGDDYELCFTASPRHRDEVQLAMDFAGVPATRIGRIIDASGVNALDGDGKAWQPTRAGHDHFA